MTNPILKHHEQSFMVQKYMLLNSQHDALQKRLAEITSPISSGSTNSSPSYSPERGQGNFSPELSSSPSDSNGNSMPFGRHSHHRRSFQGPQRRHMSISSNVSPRSSVSSSNGLINATANYDNFINPFDPSRRSSLPSALDENTLNEIESDEHKLRNVNLQIKTTLTDLLNCEHVRSDSRYRTWVQERLMDAEMELRGSRCRSRERRVSGTSEDARRLGYL